MELTLRTRCMVCGHEQDEPVSHLRDKPGRAVSDGSFIPQEGQDVAVWGDGRVAVACEEHSVAEVRTAFVLQEPNVTRTDFPTFIQNQ